MNMQSPPRLNHQMVAGLGSVIITVDRVVFVRDHVLVVAANVVTRRNLIPITNALGFAVLEPAMSAEGPRAVRVLAQSHCGDSGK